MAETETATEVAKTSIEDRITAALSPEPAPEPEKEAKTDETVREGSERQDPEPAAPEPEEAHGRDGGEERVGEGGDEKPAEEVETVELGTLADVAKHIGVEVEDLYQITVPFPDGSGKQELSIGEWKDRVRAGIDADAVEAQRKAFTEEKAAAEQALNASRQQAQQAIAEAAALTEAAEKRLLADVEAIDFAALRQSNPAEWAAKQQELQQRQAQIQEAKADVAKAWQEHSESLRSEHEQKLQEHLAREREMLLEAVPEWRDEAAWNSERKEMREYLSGQGFTEQEIENATDHRLIIMARKARLYDQQVAKQALAKKKVTQAPKRIVAPGSTTGKETVRQDQMAQLQGKLRKSGKLDDAVALIAARNRR